VTFKTRDGTKLAGWLFTPDKGESPHACIIISHGFTALIDQGLAPFAEAFADGGFASLVYDHRGYGRSDGFPLLESNPFLQMQDMRDAITFATTLPEIDETRIALWGTSYSGGHVLVVAAVDRRVRAVVSVVPLTSGSEVTKRIAGDAGFTARLTRSTVTRKEEMTSGTIAYQTHTNVAESLAWFAKSDKEQRWQNKVSVLSHDMLLEYEPGDYIHRIAPTPLLMIATQTDTRCLTDLQLEAFGRAREPKQLILLPGGHYDVYEKLCSTVSSESLKWYRTHIS
jgi:predicted acyl esterase